MLATSASNEVATHAISYQQLIFCSQQIYITSLTNRKFFGAKNTELDMHITDLSILFMQHVAQVTQVQPPEHVKDILHVENNKPVLEVISSTAKYEVKALSLHTSTYICLKTECNMMQIRKYIIYFMCFLQR